MHWLNEALIWALLVVVGYFGYVLIYNANRLGKKETENKIELLKAYLLGLFLMTFCITYAVFRFFIVLDYAMPTQ
jgi:uncharacterized YccA/Bax inhibitor family protein